MISFDTINVDMPAIDKTLIREWVKAVAKSYGRTTGDIAYIFCDDAKILEVNREFLQHDYYTDIITFDYDDGTQIAGDLFISLETVYWNADVQGVTPDEELHRVIIHGVLHLCGINDKGPGEREIMEQEEDKALLLLQQIKRSINKTI